MTSATTPQPGWSWSRVIIILLLAFVGYKLTEYAPLVPKIAGFMGDVHDIRSRAGDLQKTADGIKTSLESLERKLNFFKQQEEAARRGTTWPDR